MLVASVCADPLARNDGVGTSWLFEIRIRKPARTCRPALSAFSDVFSIDDESGTLGDLVIQLHRRAVGFVGQPVDARYAGKCRLPVDGADQSPSDALAARRGIGEEVL